MIVSRGELVEIGGGFRVPDVMAQSGAILREVGTTNRTRAADYAGAISERTALILRVHRSNFRIEGFTEQPSLAELVAVGREREDPGGRGSRQRLRRDARARPGGDRDARLACSPASRRCRTAWRRASTLVCFSGDKLLGGPQAGIILGRTALVSQVRRASADARAPRRQADLRGARGDAGGVRWRAAPGEPCPSCGPSPPADDIERALEPCIERLAGMSSRSTGRDRRIVGRLAEVRRPGSRSRHA